MNKFTKISAVLLAVVMMFGVAVSAKAANSASPAVNAALLAAGLTQAQIDALFPVSSTLDLGPTTLEQGSMGQYVKNLQMFLGITADGNFGSGTKAAVMAKQAMLGLVADGKVGPASKAAFAASVAPVTPPANNNNGGSSSDLEGTDGSIDTTSTISSYSDEEAGEGQSNVKVLGFEVETSNDGDVALKSMKLEFDPAAHTGSQSDHLDDYIEGVSIWMGSTKIGEADVDEFSENSDIYTKTVTLDEPVLKADETTKFYVTVDVVGNLDSGDITGDNWSLDVLSIRYMDGSGVVTTYNSDSDALDQQVDFVDFGTSADTELKISTDSDSPEEGIVTVDDEDGEDEVVLLMGKLKLEGESDINLDELPFMFSPVGDNMNVIVSDIRLVLGDEEYSESVPSIAGGATSTVTFEDLDFDIEAGDTVEFSIVADINGTSDYTEGDSISVSLTSVARLDIEAENEEGDNLSTSEISGTAIGEEQEFRSEGISVALVGSPSTSVSAGQNTKDDAATFTIKFKVTAVGDAVYISSLTGSVGTNYEVQRSGTATDVEGSVDATIENTTDDDLTDVGNYKIEDGESETFELTVSAVDTYTVGQYRALLTAIDWDTDDDATPDQTYTSNLDAFKTSYVNLN